MQHTINEMIGHMSHSYQQLARVLEAERHICVRMAQVVHALPDQSPAFGGHSGVLKSCQGMNKNIVSYLNSIAELEETLAEQLASVMRELEAPDEE